DEVPRLLGQRRRAGVAGADADVVDEHVDAAEPLERRRRDGAAVVLDGDVRLHGGRGAALGADLRHRGLGPLEVPVHREHRRALACEQQRGGPAVADRPARGLAGAHDDRRLALDPHDGNPGTPGSSATSKVFSAMQVSEYWPTVNTRSITCWVLHSAVSASHVASETRCSARSSSVAASSAASRGDQPSSASTVSRATSSSVTPSRRPMSVCCPNSYSLPQRHPARRMTSSRSLAGRVLLFSTCPPNTSHRFSSFGWCASTRKMLSRPSASSVERVSSSQSSSVVGASRRPLAM